jgi:hypothetical protein
MAARAANRIAMSFLSRPGPRIIRASARIAIATAGISKIVIKLTLVQCPDNCIGRSFVDASERPRRPRIVGSAES